MPHGALSVGFNVPCEVVPLDVRWLVLHPIEWTQGLPVFVETRLGSNRVVTLRVQGHLENN
jgi:hypothetical protein